VGRLLERLQGLALRLEVLLQTQALASAAGIELLLELFDSLISYRARYQRHEDLLALTDMLVLDAANPRAFAGVLRRLRTELGKLSEIDDNSLQPLLALLPAQGSGLSLEALRDADDSQVASLLHGLAVELGQAAGTLAERIGERYFTLAHGLDRRV